MSADCIITMSRRLCRFEPSLRLSQTRYAYSQFEPPRLSYVAAIVYRHILLGENSFDIIRTRAHEKIRLDFFRAEPLYVLYIAGKNVKNCKVTYARGFFASIYCFIWIKYDWKNMVIGNFWKSSQISLTDGRPPPPHRCFPRSL